MYMYAYIYTYIVNLRVPTHVKILHICRLFINYIVVTLVLFIIHELFINIVVDLCIYIVHVVL